MSKMNLSKNIKSLQKTLGKTHQEMADMLGVKRGTYSSWIDIRQVNPSMNIIIKLAELAQISTFDFINSDISDKRETKASNKDILYRKFVTSPIKIQKAIKMLLNIDHQ